MKLIILILLFAIVFVGCSTTRSTTGNPPVKVDTLHKSWCCIVDTLHKDSIVIIKVPKRIDSPYIVKVPKPVDSPYTVLVPVIVKVPKPVDSPYTVPVAIYDTVKNTFCCKYDTTKKDTTIWHTVDSVRWHTVDSIHWHTIDSVRWNTVDSIRWNTVDSIRWHTVDSIRWHTVDSIRWNTIDSIRWHTIDSVRIHYSDSCVEIPPTLNIQYGLMQYGANYAEGSKKIKAAHLKLIRVAIFFDNATSSDVADQYLAAGFNVQINFNYKQTRNPVPFPTDTAFIRKQAEKFFQYYKPYKQQIPVVCIENEYDNFSTQYNPGGYHTGTIQDYLTELKIIVAVAHKYGFKVSDAGITSTALGRWTYSKLPTDSAQAWQQKYFVAQNRDDYAGFVNMINTYAAGLRTIPIDYLNFHWYGVRGCFNGLKNALNYYTHACNNYNIITNEFGAMDSTLWPCIVKEVKYVNPAIAIAYSGTNEPNLAIELTNEMLELLQ